MQFEFMRAFREQHGDEDRSSRILRVMRATSWTVLTGTIWIMLESARNVHLERRAYADELGGALFYSLAFFLFYCSHAFFHATPCRRYYVGPSIVALAVAAGETATAFGWWELGEVLALWRIALLLVAVTWCLLWAGERAFQAQQSRQEGLGRTG